MIGVLIAALGALIAASTTFLWRGLPKERPGKNWVPTAAEVVGMAPQDRPVVSFTPPGREGTSQLPCALRGHLDTGKRLLVLLDPLNPVTPYQMEAWARRKKIGRILALAGTVIFVAGAVVFVILTYVVK